MMNTPEITSAQDPTLLLFLQHRSLNSMTAYSIRRTEGKVKACSNAITDTAIHQKCSLEGSCNGLLCFSRLNKKEIFICNPLNGESLKMSTPSTKTSRQIYGLGFSASTKEYKLVHVDISGVLKCKVNTLGTESWREVSTVPSGSIYGRSVFVNGALHWKIDANNGENHIAVFNMEKEEFGIIDLPEVASGKNDLIDLIEIRGCLGLVDYSSSTDIEVWVCEKKQWSRECRIPMKAPEGKTDNGHVKVIGLWEDGEIFLASNVDAFYSYNPKTDQMRYIHISGINPDTVISEVVALTGSLVSAMPLLKGNQTLTHVTS